MAIDDKKTVIYHNPHCSKSRQSLQILNDNGVDAEVIEYLKQPPDFKTLEHILDLLGLEPRDLMRQQEDSYSAHNLGDDQLSREALIQAMVEHPKLIERPIIIRDGKAIIGRPPQRILEILT